jgi:hypothetical protein
MGREEDRILVGELCIPAARIWIHLDLEIRPGGGVVPQREGAEAVQQRGDRERVGDDPRDVRGGREAADLEPSIGEALELLAELLEVEPAVGILAYDDQVGDRLPPRQLVRVVLIRPHEHDRPIGVRDRRGGPADPEHLGQLVDCAGCSRAAEEDDVAAAADRGVNDPAGVFSEAHGLQAGGG